jgi:hypothetical protein
LTDAVDGTGWLISPEEKAEIVGLATELTVPGNGNIPYLALISGDGLGVDFGISSLMVGGVNIVPQTDVVGNGIHGNYRDVGAFEYQGVSGIETIEGRKKAYIYPIPFSNQLYFLDEVTSVNIYNTSGTCVLSTGNVTEVNTSNLIQGIYIVKVIDKTGKEIVQKALKK